MTFDGVVYVANPRQLVRCRFVTEPLPHVKLEFPHLVLRIFSPDGNDGCEQLARIPPVWQQLFPTSPPPPTPHPTPPQPSPRSNIHPTTAPSSCHPKYLTETSSAASGAPTGAGAVAAANDDDDAAVAAASSSSSSIFPFMPHTPPVSDDQDIERRFESWQHAWCDSPHLNNALSMCAPAFIGFEGSNFRVPPTTTTPLATSISDSYVSGDCVAVHLKRLLEVQEVHRAQIQKLVAEVCCPQPAARQHPDPALAATVLRHQQDMQNAFRTSVMMSLLPQKSPHNFVYQ
eukprot:gnl/Spiro4/25775_TR12822_c0_g1_i1.p1 gnl/Spiro4/25775_TR12822_c0_g1~~gnl/Spiro4/25775_TR12822_c0_g1_i1.p1  ORF type:complete len:302 (+),score=62.64 gnl/Spiro4/25775_TR12822_c0_g1_i1:44-907(+)